MEKQGITLESAHRDKLVLESLDRNIQEAPKFGICGDVFVALRCEFERVMRERNELLKSRKY